MVNTVNAQGTENIKMELFSNIANLERLNVAAHDVLEFYLVDNEEQFLTAEKELPGAPRPALGEPVIEHKSLSFPPEFVHQQFGDTEKIYGYEDLKIQFFYTSCSMKPYIAFNYKSKIEGADEIKENLNDIIPEEFCNNTREDFIGYLNEQSSTALGELIGQETMPIRKTEVFGSSEPVEIEIRKCTFDSTQGLKEFHERIQTFLMFFIDAANFIDNEDENWIVYLMYVKCPRTGLQKFAGYATIYDFYAYPNHKRPRISQFLIIPAYQRMGFGKKLLSTIYEDLIARPEVLEITVEDASENFQTLRDVIDLINVKKIEGLVIPDTFCNSFYEKLKEVLKINKPQARKMLEILKLEETDRSNEEQYKKYRLMIKNKIHHMYKANLDTLETKNEKLVFLDGLYKELESYYQSVLEKYAAS